MIATLAAIWLPPIGAEHAQNLRATPESGSAAESADAQSTATSLMAVASQFRVFPGPLDDALFEVSDTFLEYMGVTEAKVL